MEKKRDVRPGKQEGLKKSASTNPPRVLLAEDDREMRTLLARALRKASYDVTECADGVELLDYLAPFILSEGHVEVDLIITDIRMPGVTGMSILQGAQEINGFPPMILITAFGDEETHTKAKGLGATAIFDKPFNIDELLAKIRGIVPSPD